MSETHEAHVIPLTFKNTLAVWGIVSSSLFADTISLLSSKNNKRIVQESPLISSKLSGGKQQNNQVARPL
jgi:hypothetical protein